MALTSFGSADGDAVTLGGGNGVIDTAVLIDVDADRDSAAGVGESD